MLTDKLGPQVVSTYFVSIIILTWIECVMNGLFKVLDDAIGSTLYFTSSQYTTSPKADLLIFLSLYKMLFCIEFFVGGEMDCS